MSEAAVSEEDAPVLDIRPNAEARLAPSPDERFDAHEEAYENAPVAASAAAPVASSLSFFTRRKLGKASAAASSLNPDREDERQRMTIFGARQPTTGRGKPRFLGLILTAVLLLFLVGVAAWASIFMDEGLARLFRGSDTPVVASLPQEELDEIASASGTEETEAEADAGFDTTSLEPMEPLSARDDPATEILSRVTPRDLSPDEAMARYAATGIWQLAPTPPAPVTASEMEDFYQTSLDEAPDFTDAVALPVSASQRSDGVFFTPPSPPAADTTFVLDSRGYVMASASGALTPDGVRVFAGRPPVVPPGGAVDRADVPEQPSLEAAAETSRLAGVRPRTRPENAAEQIERDGLSGRTLSELAAIRPKLRPQSAQEAAEALLAAREGEEAATAQAQTEAEAAARASTVDLDALNGALAEAVAQPDPFVGATPQAVQASLKPNTRPRNFDNIVKRTLRAQERQAQRAQPRDETEAEEQPVRVAAAQKVTPKIPSAASVSKAATERNALKFQRVNLIGVYGTQNNRRALVRMSNGRYQKVKVGDRLDGGRVNAIGESQLSYQKGGRNIVLTMPRG
jgi:type IV pilus biogenesis protein PilP